MRAIPSLTQRLKKLTQIDGTMPRLSDIPKGCAFHPRCQECMDMCKENQPDLIDIGPTQVACWRYHDIKL
jgi:peptide/nickel transport system ATP-binding protein